MNTKHFQIRLEDHAPGWAAGEPESWRRPGLVVETAIGFSQRMRGGGGSGEEAVRPSVACFSGPLHSFFQARVVFGLVFLLWLLMPPMAWSEPVHQRVLLIHTFSRDFAPFSAVAHGFRSELARNNPRKVEFVEVSLQTFLSGDVRAEVLADFIAASFAEHPPDLVAAIGAPAAQFYLQTAADHFPTTPLLIAGADNRRLGEISAGPLIVSASLELDLNSLLADMRLARPELKRIHYITGVTPLEAFWESEVLAGWGGGDITVESLSHLPFDEVLQAVRKLSSRDAVFIGVLDRDAAGVPFEANAALAELRAASAAPIFGMASQQLGLGIVGGRLIDMELAGQRAAAAAVRLLAGTAPADIHIEPVRPGIPTYDWRELRRWKIAGKSLPPGSEVRFRAPTLWETHRETALLGSGIIAAQSILIFLLISARKRTREMHDHLDLAADAAGAGFCQIDFIKGSIRSTGQWNRLYAFTDTSQVSLKETLERVHPDDRETLRTAIEMAARNKSRYNVEHRVMLPDGRQRWIASLGCADQSSREDSLRVRGVSIDITARKRDEAEIENQREALSHLSRVGALGVISGSLAHELNQPLGIILSNAQAAQRMLARTDPDLDEIRAILSDIVGEDRRAGEVIRGWRTLLRRGQVGCVVVNPGPCLEEIIKLTRSELAARDISLRADYPDDLPSVTADPVQLQQVFLNLILNSRDALLEVPPNRKRIEIRAWREAAVVRVAVRDWGVGLPADRKILFEPFRTTKENGLGMGLAICETILTHMGGRLWAEQPEGPGAEFHLSLPVDMPAQ